MTKQSSVAQRVPAHAPPNRLETFRRCIYGLIKFVSVWVYQKKWYQPPENATFSARAPRHFHTKPWTSPIMLLGDNQLQHELGEPDSVSNMADRWSEPSTRPPLAMLFGHALLDDQLKKNAQLKSPLPLLHMGDAINTSCRTEFDRFRDSILRAKGWYPERQMQFAMIPGNHDGFFAGNFQPRLRSWFSAQTGMAKLWRAVWNSQGVEWSCRCSDAFRNPPTAQGPLTKNGFIEEYFRLLTDLHGSGSLLRRTESGRILLTFGPSSGSESFIQIAFGCIDPDNPQRSFVLQIVRLPAAEGLENEAPTPFMMLLDTSNYCIRPRNAGMQGSIGPLQVKFAKELWEEIRKSEAVRAKPCVLMFGLHHNLHALKPSSRKQLEQLALALDQTDGTRVLPFCVSAHRHRGGWYAHAQHWRDGNRSRYLDWIELNTSSMVDWPLAVRDMRIWIPGQARPNEGWRTHNFVVESNQTVLATPEQLDAQLNNTAMGLDESCRAIADKVAEQRTSPLRLDPVRRIGSVLRNPVRDAYVAEYEILFASAASLEIVLTNPMFMAAAQAHGRDQDRCQAIVELRSARAINPQCYEARYSATGFDPVSTFRAIRAAIQQAYSVIEELRRQVPAVNDFVVALILHSVREDYYSQWRANKFLPPPVADRWYRCASNIGERFALVRLRRTT